MIGEVALLQFCAMATRGVGSHASTAQETPLPQGDDWGDGQDAGKTPNGSDDRQKTAEDPLQDPWSWKGDWKEEKEKGKKEKKVKKEKRNKHESEERNSNHDRRRDRREPAWHGDAPDRWREPRKGKHHRRRSSSSSRSSRSGNRGRKQDRRQRRQRPPSDPSSSPSSSSSSTTSSSSSSSSSSKSRSKRKSDRRRRVDHSKNVKIPCFDGTSSRYRDYRRSVKRYTQLVGREGTGLALQLNLTGDALEVTRHLSARRLKARDGVKKLLMVLDDEYRGMEEDRLDEAAEAFIQCRKMTGESMSRYIRRLKQVRRELEEEDENMYVSEKFFSWLLLRKSGLSSEEKSRIRGAAHCSENAKDIAYAMKRLFPGTLHYRPPERGHHPFRRENGPKHEKNAYVVGGGGDRDSKDDRSDPLPSVPEEDSADGSEDSSSDESAEYESTPLPENEVMLAMKTVRQAEKQGLDVYALYKNAKYHQRDGKKNRGFFKGAQGQSKEEREKQIAIAKANSECRSCHQKGHWEGDAICPNYDPNKPHKGRRRPDPKMDAHVVSLDLEFVAKDVMAAGVGHGSPFICAEAMGIIDSGCQQTVMGLSPFTAWEKCLKEHGLLKDSIIRQDSEAVFRFGNNGRLKALFSAPIPIWLYGKAALLEVAVVAGETPLLLSRHTLASMKLCIDFASGGVTSEALGIDKREPLQQLGGHLVIDLLKDPPISDCAAYKVAHVSAQDISFDHVDCESFCEDFWHWCTASVFCRRHVVRRCCPFSPNDDGDVDDDNWSPYCIRIAMHDCPPSVLRRSDTNDPLSNLMICVINWKSLEKQQFENTPFWHGETWFWIGGTCKREIFKIILQHSCHSIPAPTLRLAWKSFFGNSHLDHGNVSSVSRVLECERGLPLSMGSQECRINPINSSGLAARVDPDQCTARVDPERCIARVDPDQCVSESVQAECAGTSCLVQDSYQRETPSSRSNTGNDFTTERPVATVDIGTRAEDRICLGKEIHQGGNDASTTSALGGSMSVGPAAQSDRISDCRIEVASSIGERSGSAVANPQHEASREPRLGSHSNNGYKPRREGHYQDQGGREAGGGCQEDHGGSKHALGSGEAKSRSTIGDDSLPRTRSLRKADRSLLRDSLQHHAFVARDLQSGYEKSSCKKGTRPLKLLEVFCGMMTLSIVAGELGWSVLQPIDKELGKYAIDLTDPASQDQVLQVMHDEEPDLVMFAPSCGDYSPLQKILPRCPIKRLKRLKRLQEKRAVSSKLWRFVKRCMKLKIKGQLKVGIIGVENPRQSEAWKIFRSPGFPAYIDQCRFGLKLHGGKRLVKKPTIILCSDQEYAQKLTALCQCKSKGGRKHDHIEGSFRHPNGFWVNHSAACGAWTRALCKHLLDSAKAVLRPGVYELSCEPQLGLGVLMASLGDTLENDVFAEDLTGDESEPQGSAHNLGEVRRLAQKLHVKYGHPTNEVLARTLRFGGATEEVVEAAKRVTCDVCDRAQKPKQPPKTTAKQATQFNQIVGLDLFWIRDSQDNQHVVLSTVDQASTYHVLKLIPEKSSSTVATGFAESWVTPFGSPHTIYVDQGKEFEGYFSVLSEFLGSFVSVIPLESSWKNGITERHGGIAKQIVHRVIQQHSASTPQEVSRCLAETAQAKNSLARVHGYSPAQWVLGQEPSVPHSVLDSPHQLAVHDHVCRGGEFAIQASIREAARLCWIQLDNSYRYRRAILRHPRLQKQVFFPGEQVFFYQESQGGWRGPAVVVAEQSNRVLWISYRKALLKLSVEHVRSATSEEVMGKQMVDDELDDQFVHVHHEGQSRGYVDLLPQNPPIPPARRKLLGKRPPPPDWEDLEEDAKRNREVDPRFEIPVEDGLSFVEPPADAADPGGGRDDDERSRTTFSYTPEDDIPYQNEAGEEEVVPDLGNIYEDMFDDSTDDDDMTSHAYGDGGPREALERSQTVERFHEIPGEISASFGPVRNWRDRVNERLKTRTDVSAQNNERESKLGRHFKKKESRTPDPKDVFFAEMGFLQEAEQHEPIVSFSPSACFRRVFCEKCQRQHDVFQVETQTQTPVGNDQTKLGDDQFTRSDGTIVIEHDVGTRNLLNPHKIMNFPVSIHDITGQRLTEMIFEDGSIEVVDDCWDNDEGPRQIKLPWKGRTVFYLRGDGSKGPSKEYQWQKLEESKQDMFRVAMDKEWQSFIDLDAVRVVKKDEAQRIPSSRILPTRFVLTNKDPTGETLICKARLVCGGHRDPDISLLRTDAPTTDALGVHLILVLAASFRWRIQSGDVSTAFL